MASVSSSTGGQRQCGMIGVAEGKATTFDFLIVFVAFACHQHHIIFSGMAHGMQNRAGAIFNDLQPLPAVPAPAMIWAMMSAGASLRGLSLVTIR